MLTKKMEKALNEQINKEMWSAYLYLSMAAYFEDNNLPGFANWMRVQYQEEMTHGMKIFDYINDRGGRVLLKPIKEVPTEWADTHTVIEETLKHERVVTESINDLVNLAVQEKDHATNNMLQWFVGEQVEEEANADELLNKVKMTDGKAHALMMIDKELAGRQFVDETQQQ
ncbi:MAG: ferritin [Bacteroidales bacterium]|nr:ferritin [Bacteroidales bacterium]MCF8328631.1 ferritin [Bacteroidales bacterium]